MSESAAPAPSTPAASSAPVSSSGASSGSSSAAPESSRGSSAVPSAANGSPGKPAAPAAKASPSESPKTGAGAAARAAAAAEAPAEEPAAAERSEAKPEKRAYKYKANKEEFVEELTDEEIAQRLAKVRGSEKAFQERAALEKDFREFLVALKSDPWSVLQDPALGVDLNALAQERLAAEYERKLEEAKLSPEQKEARAAKAEAEKYRAQIEKIESEKRAAAEKAYVAQVEQKVSKTLEGALTALGVDATPEALAEAAQVMKLNLKHMREFGGVRLTPEQIAEEVRSRQTSRHERFHKSVLNNLKGEKLVQYLGGLDSPVIQAIFDAIPPDSAPAKKLMLARLAKLKGVESFEPPPAPAAKEEPREKKPFDRAAWRREVMLNHD